MSLTFNSRLHFEIAAASGKNNKPMEDCTAYFIAPAAAPLIEQIAVAVVADGISEHLGGEEASHIAVDTIKQYFLSNSTTDPLKMISSSIEAAHNAILERKRSKPELAGMGSTVTVAVIAISQEFTDIVELIIGSVGDSRAYHIRAGETKRITTDHTWMQEELDAGRLNRKEATVRSSRHVLTRYLGMDGTITSDISPVNLLLPGDTILLCTDGLTDLVEDNELKGIIASRTQTDGLIDLIEVNESKGFITPIKQTDGLTDLVEVNESKGSITPRTQSTAASKLVSLALERGGYGNITVMTIGFERLSPSGARLAVPVILQSILTKPLTVAPLFLGSILLLGIVLLVLRGLEPFAPVLSTVRIEVAQRTLMATMVVGPSTPTASAPLGQRASTPTIVASASTPYPVPDTLTPTASVTLVQRTSTPTIVAVTSTPRPVPDTLTPTVQSSSTIAISASPTKQPAVNLRYPAVKLLEPQNGQKVVGETAVFEWQEAGLLEIGDAHQLWLRHLGSPAWEKSFVGVGGRLGLNVRYTIGYGDYIWSVFVLNAQRQIVSQSEERKITWQPKEGGPSSDSPPAVQPPPTPPIFIK